MLTGRNNRLKKGLSFALACLWLPVNALAAQHYFVFLKYPGRATQKELEAQAHLVFQQGVHPSVPTTMTNAASQFFRWLTTDDPINNFITMFPSIQAAREDLGRLGPMTGLLIEVSPDNRAFNLGNSIRNLRGVIPNQGAEREAIARFLNEVENDRIPVGTLVAALPAPTPGPPEPAIVRGDRIRQATVYLNNRLRGNVSRNEADGPFVESPTSPYTASGYPFERPSEPFPAEHLISVAPGTSNVTFVEGCGPSTSFRISRLAVPDRDKSMEETCKERELIDFEEFHKRYLRSRGSASIPLLLLLG